MNAGIFKLVFSRRLGMCVPVSEALPSLHAQKGSSGHKAANPCQARFASLKPLAWCMALALAPPVWANPTGAQVVHGSASFATQGANLTVTNSPNAIINWQSFSIPQGSTTHFQQQSASSVVLNRVVGPDPSHILGTLSSNGNVFLINPAGILVGAGARIDVNGLVASTLNLSDADFLAGRMNFTHGLLGGTVRNQGQITTPDGGQVVLLGSQVINEGQISASKGNVLLAAGEKVEILNSATPNVMVEVSGTEGQATNLGQVVADSGRIGVLAAVIRNQGVVNASSAVAEGGRLFFRSSQRTELGETSELRADGTQGGEVTLITSQNGQISGELVARGSISAQGNKTRKDGSLAGGFVETSAAQVDFSNVSVRAAGGTWLIDPTNVTIDATRAASIVTSLNASTNVTVETTGTAGDGLGNGDITVSSAIAKTAGGEATLTLHAHNNITINSAISSNNSKLNLNLFADSDQLNGGVAIVKSSIDLNQGALNFTGGLSLYAGGLINLTVTSQPQYNIFTTSFSNFLDNVRLGSHLLISDSYIEIRNGLTLTNNARIELRKGFNYSTILTFNGSQLIEGDGEIVFSGTDSGNRKKWPRKSEQVR